MSSHAGKEDYYDLLGVGREADKSEIKKAFYKLAKVHHPDRGGDEEKFKEINEAYSILSDSEKRQKYDQYGFDGPDMQSGFGGAGFSSFGDIFDMFFGGNGGGFGGGGRRRQRRVRGDDIEAKIKLTLHEAAFGVEKTFHYKRNEPCDKCDGVGALNPSDVKKCTTCNGQGQVMKTRRTFMGMMQQAAPCPKCNGSGEKIKKPCPKCKGRKILEKKHKTTVKIPAGVESGMNLKMQGRGDIPTKNAVPGDLYISIYVKDDPRFVRNGTTIESILEIDVILAIVGGKITIDTLDGDHMLQIEAGTQPGTKIRLRNKGVPDLNRKQNRGDHIVNVKINIPNYKKLTNDQKEAIKILSKQLKTK